MSRRAGFALFIFLWLGAACNLTSERPQPTALPPSLATAGASRPAVTISTPADGAEVVVGTDILIRGQASDSQGVTRVQLVANDRIVRTISSESSGGDRNMAVTIDYRPVVTGRLKLEVVAWRGNVAGKPTSLTLQVRANPGQVLATIAPDTTETVIDPNDPTCRVLTNITLNVRVNAGTDFQRITTLGSGDQLPVLARLVDDSWWQVSLRDGTAGWVAGRDPNNANERFVSIFGDCTLIPALPLPQPDETSQTPTPGSTPAPAAGPGGDDGSGAPGTDTDSGGGDAGRPDLSVVRLQGPARVTLGGEASVSAGFEVTVSNGGAAPGGRFRVSLGGIAGADPATVTVNGLGPGESISFSFELTFDETGDVELTATVDSAGEVDESDENNNSATHSVTVAAT